MYDNRTSVIGEPTRGEETRRLLLSEGPRFEFILTLVLLALAVALLLAIDLRGGKISVALNDPATETGGPFFLGAISNGGVVALVVAATATTMAAAAHVPRARLFASVALLSALLAVDDLFLLHEGPIRDVLPWFEYFMFAVYGVATVAILWAQRRFFLSRRHLPLWLGCACLALSLALDSAFEGVPVPAATEDLSKFAGFLLWSSYWSRLSLQAICNRISH